MRPASKTHNSSGGESVVGLISAESLQQGATKCAGIKLIQIYASVVPVQLPCSKREVAGDLVIDSASQRHCEVRVIRGGDRHRRCHAARDGAPVETGALPTEQGVPEGSNF